MKPGGRSAVHAAVLGAMAIAYAVSCTDDPVKEPSAAPRNSCLEHGCSSFQQPPPTPQCDERAASAYCYVNANFDYALFVSMPQQSGYAPDVTFALTASDLAKTFSGSSCPIGETCTLLPAVADSRGVYEVSPQIATDVNRYVGNDRIPTTIPVHVTFRPLTPGIPISEESVAADQGYPLLARLATATADLQVDTGLRGPFGAPPVGWSATLAVGSYERTLRPDPPFDDAFPPHREVVTVDGRELTRVSLELDDPVSRRFTIEGDVDAPDLTGFTAALEDSITHQRISRVATLGPGKNDVVLFTTKHEVLQDVPVELVVAPPPGAEAVPALIAPATPSIPLTQTYPRIPAAVKVSGVVVAAGTSAPLRARLMVASVPEVGELISSKNVLLRYEVAVVTDDQGHWTVKLPPGRFDVAIVPDDRSGYAMAESTLVVTDRDPSQAGKSFTVVPKAVMRGVATLADGTPLADASVEARPSAEPGNISPNIVPTTATLPRFSRSMRTAHARTDALGHFAMALDPGYYDVVVMPKDGTRFPWVLSTSHKMEDKDIDLETVQIPAPIRLTRTLLAQNNTTSGAFHVRGALARAFTIPPGKHIAVEIGRAVSDSEGHLELFLAPSRPR
jgi:hypothetical protein